MQKDSILLWSTISQVINKFNTMCKKDEIRSMTGRFVDAFLACRLREFKNFYQYKYKKTTTQVYCTHWQHQLAPPCMGENNFERYFAIVRHLPQSRVCPFLHNSLKCPDVFPNWLPSQKFYFCLDEFQSDFDWTAEAYAVHDGYEYFAARHGLMNDLLSSILDFGDCYGHKQWKIVLAGTSSYLNEVRQKVQSLDGVKRQCSSQGVIFYNVDSKFKQIRNYWNELP
jgi:hypothetical protein